MENNFLIRTKGINDIKKIICSITSNVKIFSSKGLSDEVSSKKVFAISETDKGLRSGTY